MNPKGRRIAGPCNLKLENVPECLKKYKRVITELNERQYVIRKEQLKYQNARLQLGLQPLAKHTGQTTNGLESRPNSEIKSLILWHCLQSFCEEAQLRSIYVVN